MNRYHLIKQESAAFGVTHRWSLVVIGFMILVAGAVGWLAAGEGTPVIFFVSILSCALLVAGLVRLMCRVSYWTGRLDEYESSQPKWEHEKP